MWENETIVLITSLKKRLLAGNNKVRFSKISADTALPAYIKAIFKSQVELFIQNESPISIKSTPHFDLSENDMAHIKDRFIDVFREAASFSNEEVEEVLKTAIILRMDYLVKPVDTMRRLLFNGKTNINIEKMNRILHPFMKVLPYAEKLIEECNRLSYENIESDEYTNLLNEMLHRMTGQDPVKLAIGDFSVLIDFISETKGEEITRVEGQVVQEFMADRNLIGFRRAVDVEMKLGREDFDLVDLEMTLKRYLELKEEFSQLKEEEVQESVAKTKPVEPIEETITEAKPEAETSEPEEEMSFEDLDLNETDTESFDLNDIVTQDTEKPLTEDIKINPPETKISREADGWDLDEVLGSDDLIQEEKASPEPKEHQEIVKPKPEQEKKEKPKKQMRIIRRDQSKPAEAGPEEKNDLDRHKEAAMSGLHQMIDSKTEKIFVKKLFSNDQEAYNHLMKKLEESESWRVAKILIDNELFKRDVDPFSREAIKLVDLVYSRYYPEEGVGGK